MTIWIKDPLAVWTGNDKDARGGVVVSGDTIVELIPAGKQPQQAYDEIFDARTLVLVPGLVNCHHHFYQTLTRAFPAALNKELFSWLRALYPVWAGLDEAAVTVSTRLALAELMLSGCTLVSDHHYLFNQHIQTAIDIQIAECERAGMRAVLTRGSMSLGKSAGGLPPDTVVQTDTDILNESERLLCKVRDRGNTMIQVALAPCSPFSVTPELMESSAALARSYGALLHTHLAETEDENDFCIKRFGLRPVDYLEKVGWLAGDVWLAHGIFFNENEIQRLGRAGIGVSHCPSSNMVLASGICEVNALEAAGVAVGLGVDGSASNDGSNMIQEVRQGFLLQRLKYGAAAVTHEDALRWATIGGARVLGQDQSTGSIEVGKKADLALFALDDLRFSGAGDALAALVLCGAHQVSDLMVNGDWRVRNGEIPGLDIHRLRAEHQQAADRLAARA
ncbi:8-oxoguanine deaminase [Teredinibacter turnerae]|uniref:8-oxoguanine deaminase n=1 Tax=Teredinibacter turnerae TaxID=2426 RepID=UPI000403C37F|nr:8-oxoguanine deaminase [Teredinibacter turnerae]